MAKSLRSKRRRKVRAEKRVINAKKELEKLREIAAKLRSGKTLTEAGVPDVEMREPGESGMLVDAKATSKREPTKINNQWMNQRKIKQIKQKIKRQQKKKSRRGGSAGLSSRKVKKGLN